MNDFQRQSLYDSHARRDANIHIGHATLLACSRNGKSGLALPGGGFTSSRLGANDAVREMNRLMGGSA